MYLTDLIGMLLSVGPAKLSLRAVWPLHRALCDLHKTGARAGLTEVLPQMSFRPDAKEGLIEEHVNEALFQLISTGVLQIVGEGWDTAIQPVDQDHLRPYRRALMAREPRVADLIYQAGTSWAAFTLTAEKNWDSARASVERRRASEIPKRRHGPVGVAR